MSRKLLTKSQITLLSKGPKFCPTTKGSSLNIKTDIKEFTRKIQLQDQFKDNTITDNSYVKLKSSYTPQTKNKDLSKIIELVEKCEPIEKHSYDNLKKDERKALSELKNDPDLIIKKAYKGNVLVLMSKTYYKEKLERVSSSSII